MKDFKFKIGSRVMIHSKSQGVYNGKMGTVTDPSRPDGFIRVMFDDLVPLDKDITIREEIFKPTELAVVLTVNIKPATTS